MMTNCFFYGKFLGKKLYPGKPNIMIYQYDKICQEIDGYNMVKVSKAEIDSRCKQHHYQIKRWPISEPSVGKGDNFCLFVPMVIYQPPRKKQRLNEEEICCSALVSLRKQAMQEKNAILFLASLVAKKKVAKKKKAKYISIDTIEGKAKYLLLNVFQKRKDVKFAITALRTKEFGLDFNSQQYAKYALFYIAQHNMIGKIQLSDKDENFNEFITKKLKSTRKPANFDDADVFNAFSVDFRKNILDKYYEHLKKSYCI